MLCFVVIVDWEHSLLIWIVWMHNFSARSYWYMVLVGGLTLCECVRFEAKWRMERGREGGWDIGL